MTRGIEEHFAGLPDELQIEVLGQLLGNLEDFDKAIGIGQKYLSKTLSSNLAVKFRELGYESDFKDLQGARDILAKHVWYSDRLYKAITRAIDQNAPLKELKLLLRSWKGRFPEGQLSFLVTPVNSLDVKVVKLLLEEKVQVEAGPTWPILVDTPLLKPYPAKFPWCNCCNDSPLGALLMWAGCPGSKRLNTIANMMAEEADFVDVLYKGHSQSYTMTDCEGIIFQFGQSLEGEEEESDEDL